MKSLIEAVVIAALMSAPLVAFAQSNQPLTRAQVRADLVQVEKAAYSPSDWMHCPDASGYGSDSNGTSQAGNWTDQAVSTYSAPVAHYGLLGGDNHWFRCSDIHLGR